jgi:hypothetical protein
VMCPAGLYASWRRCLGCRHLAAAEDERATDRSCATQPVFTDRGNRYEPPEDSWAALFIELL